MGIAPVDLVVLGLLLLSGIWGFLRGFVREVLGIAGWLGAVAATWFVLPFAQPLARDLIAIETVADGAAALLIFLIALVIFSLIAGAIAQQVRSSSLGALDRALGFLFGLGRGALVAVIALLVVQFALRDERLPPWIAEARALPLVQRGADLLQQVLPLDQLSDRLRVPGRSADADQQRQLRELMNPPGSARIDAPPAAAVYNEADRNRLDQLFQPQRP